MKRILTASILMTLLAYGDYMDTEKYSGNIAPKTIENYYSVESEIYYASESYDVPFWLIASMLFNESRFDDNAKSWTKVTGIAMITKAAAKRYGINKSTVAGQIDGMAKMLRHHFDNFPDYYNDHDKWTLSAVQYNSGKRSYFNAKKSMMLRGITGSNITVSNILKFYRKQGRNYYKKVLKAKQMFV